MSLSAETQFNHLLAALPQETMLRLHDSLELVDLKQGRVIGLPAVVCQYVYFPTTATISLVNVMEDGSTGGIALVGNEGVVGISQFLGGGSTPTQAEVHSAGKCMRLSAWSMKEEFNRMGHLMSGLLRYTQALMTQVTQAAVCNRHHSVDQQFCRLLLQSLDRVTGPKLTMTHEAIGFTLGVRRESVSMVANQLRNQGIIEYSRGRITVLNRQAVEARACECYSVVRKEYSRLVPNFKALDPGGKVF
jgi:CRP-like cAMP-binding protein